MCLEQYSGLASTLLVYHVTIGPSAVDVVVRYWHRVGGESLVARRRGSGVRLPLGLVVARQSRALRRTYN